MKERIFRLKGQMQHYAWGGYDYIPNLLGFDNAQHRPCAEYWLGAHAGAPGILITQDGNKLLSEVIRENPEKFLGKFVYEHFGELPYLLKVLDVREMLSIQVHPTKLEAVIGFEAEEAAGIPINAIKRNYKDRNHKPEVMIALGEFWLLHGFKTESEIRQVLKEVNEFNFLQEIFEENNYRGLYKYVMEMPQKAADFVLKSLIKHASKLDYSKIEPGYWVNKLYQGNIPEENIDRGIFSIYFFNIVQLQKGQGIFQAAGVPHAYLEGQNVELMANSDNVLRGGLTPKHIDVAELLKHIHFERIVPQIIEPKIASNGGELYPLSVPDFGICTIHLNNGREYVNESNSPEIFLVLEGVVHCGEMDFKKGASFYILPNTQYTIRGIKDAQLFKAYVPN